MFRLRLGDLTFESPISKDVEAVDGLLSLVDLWDVLIDIRGGGGGLEAVTSVQGRSGMLSLAGLARWVGRGQSVAEFISGRQ